MRRAAAERLPTLGSREEIEDGVEPLPALRTPVMTAAIIMKFLLFINSIERAATFKLLRLSICALCGTLYLKATHVQRNAAAGLRTAGSSGAA